MFDGLLRPVITPSLKKGADILYGMKLSPNMVTSIGLIFALMVFAALYGQHYIMALVFLGLNRLADGLDGPLAQIFAQQGKDHNGDFGAYFDIVSDFVFYAGYPLFFALGAPQYMSASAVLLAAFILSGTSFLAYAIIAEKKQLKTEAQGKKGFFYMAGLMEGSETIAFFAVMALLPDCYAILAYTFAGLCVLTLIGRFAMAYKNF